MSTATASSASPSPRRRRWHTKFKAMIPAIVKYARFPFRHVRGQDRQDLIQETIANAMVAFVRLARRGRESVAHASVLAKYAIRQIKDGRRVGSKLIVREMLSKYGQKHKGFHVISGSISRPHLWVIGSARRSELFLNLSIWVVESQ